MAPAIRCSILTVLWDGIRSPLCSLDSWEQPRKVQTLLRLPPSYWRSLLSLSLSLSLCGRVGKNC
uniref:Uncharacterized protein n=1 Tax=Arundo donax TaxID=35708 RepID=A0A0A8ZQ64_ARUDO